MINNKSITLFAIAWGNQLEFTNSVLRYCNSIFPVFDRTILYSKIENLLQYNTFMVENLNEIIDTDFVLTVQPDGYIINPKLWNNKFLDYDYVGAPWPWHKVSGNGGFSLRSKKFLNESSKLKYNKYHEEYDCCPEDYFMCVLNRDHFIKNGCLFPSMETAIEFSFEHPIPGINKTIFDSFGFHGKHNILAMG